jgi:RNA polymerase sigma factor (sigma-70 family)
VSNDQIFPKVRPSPDAQALAVAIVRVASGDRAAFEEVYRKTSAKLFGLCLHILPSRQEAEDVVQEVYIAVWRRASSFDPDRGAAMTWLITLTRNRAIDRLRASGAVAARPIAFDGGEDLAPSASDALETGDEARRLSDCIGTLNGGEALLIRTAFFQGSSYTELAARTETPLGTIKSRIRRALIKLRDCLG